MQQAASDVAAELITTAEAVAQLRLDSATAEPDLAQKVSAASSATESILGFAVVDATRTVYGVVPAASDAAVELDVAQVRSATAHWLDSTYTAQSQAAGAVTAFGVNERTFARAPSGGWNAELLEAEAQDVYWTLAVGAQSVEKIWKEAALMLLSALYDDRVGESWASAYKAATALLASERRRV